MVITRLHVDGLTSLCDQWRWKFSRGRILFSWYVSWREKWYNSIDSRKSAWCCVKSDSWISSSLICHNLAKNSYFQTMHHFSRNPLAMDCPFRISFWRVIIPFSLFHRPSTRGMVQQSTYLIGRFHKNMKLGKRRARNMYGIQSATSSFRPKWPRFISKLFPDERKRYA